MSNTGKQAKKWRKKHGFGNEFMNHVPETRFAEIEQGLTQNDFRNIMSNGDHISNPSLIINVLRESSALGLSGSHQGLRSYNKMPSDSFVSTNGYYKLCREDDGNYTIGMRLHFLFNQFDKSYRYNEAWIPRQDQSIPFAKNEHYFLLTIDQVIIPLQYKGTTCLVAGKFHEVSEEQAVVSKDFQDVIGTKKK